MKVYVKSIAQISVQEPLSEAWKTNPVVPAEKMPSAQDPSYSAWIPPMAARRMAKVMKRAVATSKVALEKAGIAIPDAIITGTGLGCLDYTEKFLKGLCENAEECVQPTLFMNSTHNTISSQIALTFGCHGYNNTYSHGIISFQSALYDGFLAIKEGHIHNALTGGFDEMTQDKFRVMDRVGFWKDTFCGDTALSAVISDDPSNSMCEIAGMDILFKPTEERMSESLDTILSQAGMTRSDINLIVCPNRNASFLKDKPVMEYEPVFGKSFTSPAFGLYMGALSVSGDRMGNVLVCDGDDTYKSFIVLR